MEGDLAFVEENSLDTGDWARTTLFSVSAAETWSLLTVQEK